jgi:hypothetical protein
MDSFTLRTTIGLRSIGAAAEIAPLAKNYNDGERRLHLSCRNC